MNAKEYAEIVRQGGEIKYVDNSFRIYSPNFKSGSRKINLTTLSAIERDLRKHKAS